MVLSHNLTRPIKNTIIFCSHVARQRMDLTSPCWIIRPQFNLDPGALKNLANKVGKKEEKMDILKEFLESSTIHGLAYISSAKVSKRFQNL